MLRNFAFSFVLVLLLCQGCLGQNKKNAKLGLEPEGNSGSAKLFLATDSAKFIKLDLQRLQEVTVTSSNTDVCANGNLVNNKKVTSFTGGAWSDCGSDDPTYCYRFDYDDAQVNLTWIVRICNASDVDSCEAVAEDNTTIVIDDTQMEFEIDIWRWTGFTGSGDPLKALEVEFKVSGRGATSKGAQSGNGVVISGAGDIGWTNQVTVDGDQSRSLAGQTTAETNGNNVLVTWCLPSGQNIIYDPTASVSAAPTLQVSMAALLLTALGTYASRMA